MRISDLKGVSVATMPASDSDPAAGDDGAQRARRKGPSPWAVRREFRSTYRADRGPDEHVTSGTWFRLDRHTTGQRRSDPVEISVEADLARELGVALGDSITWDVQGVPVYSVITSLREVNWARFAPNFFVVFAPGALERAPQSWVAMVTAPDPVVRGRVQREIAEHAANVTAIDLGAVQHAIESVVSRMVLAIRFMAIFSLITGAIVLIGAIATSRWQRVREGTLLRTLGATRPQVLVILSVEYAALGLGSAVVASLLATAAGFGLAHWVFDIPFVVPVAALVLLAFGLVALTTGVGLWNSLEVLQRPPLEVLRSD
jgi:putative ABC transport system permease protein